MPSKPLRNSPAAQALAMAILPPADLIAEVAQGFVRGWTATALADVLKLAQFGAWAAGEFRSGFDGMDGGDAQDAMDRFGVLVKTVVTEPCGEVCNCSEFCDFPTDCYKFPPGVAQIVKECGK